MTFTVSAVQKKWLLGAAAVIALNLLVYFKGKSDGVDSMKREQVTKDEALVKQDKERVLLDSLARDSVLRIVVQARKEADSLRGRMATSHATTRIADSTHIIIKHEPSIDSTGQTIPARDSVIVVPKELTVRIIGDSIAFEKEHDLRISLENVVKVDSSVIFGLRKQVKDQDQEIKDLKELKDKPGVLSDALLGMGIGAASGATVGGLPGTLIGSGMGLLTGAALHIIFRR